MKNEYGMVIDRNHYTDTIMQDTYRCYICGRTCNLQRHEIFNAAFRDKSKRLGLWIWVCKDCHWEITHVNAAGRINLKADGQLAAMDFYGLSEDEFIQMFGKNYL